MLKKILDKITFVEMRQRQGNNVSSIRYRIHKIKSEFYENYKQMKNEDKSKHMKAMWAYLLCGAIIMIGIVIFVAPVLRFF